MSTACSVDFWYEFASPYSYLSAMRIENLANAADVRVHWKPFLLGPIFQKQGFQDSPFNAQPDKRAYMWRDMARCAKAQGLPFTPPSPFPGNGLNAARVALLGCRHGWGADFTKATYTAYFGDGRDLSDPTVLHDLIARTAPGNAREIWEESQSQDIKTALRDQTEEAGVLGIFGAPTFMVGKEMFWGNDRLEAAFSFATDED